jgi:hypothetical protein
MPTTVGKNRGHPLLGNGRVSCGVRPEAIYQ